MIKSAIFLAVSMLTLPLLAQEGAQPASQKPPAHYYKLNLTVQETTNSGQVTNARTYVTTVRTGGNLQQIRTGTRVPVITGTGTGTQSTQFTYIDLGVDFDVRDVEEIGDRLGLQLNANVSSLAAQENIGELKEPVIRQNKWDSAVVIPIGKSTVVFSADDLNDKGKMQVEVTATKLD